MVAYYWRYFACNNVGFLTVRFCVYSLNILTCTRRLLHPSQPLLTPTRQTASQLIKKCHLSEQTAVILYMNETFFLIAYFQDCAKVRLFVGFEIFKTIFQVKKQSMTIFYCLAKEQFCW